MRSASCSVTRRSPPARCTCIPHPTGCAMRSTGLSCRGPYPARCRDDRGRGPPAGTLAAAPATSGGDRAERVRALLRPGFLAEVWQADGQVFAPPREHPLLGLRKCAVIDCGAGVRKPNTDLCKLCVEKFKASGLPMTKFTAIPANKITKPHQFARVPGSPRPP